MNKAQWNESFGTIACANYLLVLEPFQPPFSDVLLPKKRREGKIWVIFVF
jgi:hypothetical protein